MDGGLSRCPATCCCVAGVANAAQLSSNCRSASMRERAEALISGVRPRELSGGRRGGNEARKNRHDTGLSQKHTDDRLSHQNGTLTSRNRQKRESHITEAPNTAHMPPLGRTHIAHVRARCMPIELPLGQPQVAAKSSQFGSALSRSDMCAARCRSRRGEYW